MSEPQLALDWQTLTVEAVEVQEVAMRQELTHFNLEAIAKTVFRLVDATPQVPPAKPPEMSLQVMKTLQRLVAIIGKLQSPEGGWPADLEPTVENLLPYVTEEAYEVLDALQVDGVAPQVSLTEALEEVLQMTALPGYLLIEDLIPRLLWYVARGSYELMRLLCGVEASVFEPSQGWRTGVLRLVAVLEAKLGGDRHWSLDLATNQPPAQVLTEQALIRSEEDTFCQQPTWLAAFSDQLLQQIQAVTPEASIFLQPVTIEALTPSQNWESGALQLRLAFEFTEGTKPVVADANAVSGAQSGDPELSLKFADATTLEQYVQSLVRQPLTAAIAQLPATCAWSRDRILASQPPQALSMIVEAAALIAEAVPNAKELGQDCSTHPGILLDRWLPQLLWQLTSSSYEVMHWMGGMQASVLLPGDRWQTGTLRLWAMLAIKTAEADWHFDISTGQLLKAAPSNLPSSTILRLDAPGKSQGLQRAETVLTMLGGQIQATAPFLQVLMQGTAMQLQEATNPWQEATLKLEVGLELMSEMDWLEA